MIEINIDSELKVSESTITNGTPTEVLYQKADGTLGQIPGFIYDEVAEQLQFQNSIFKLNIGQTEIAPSIFVPTGGVLNYDNFGFGVSDLTMISGDVIASLGGQDNNVFVEKNSGNIIVKSLNNFFTIGSADFVSDFLGDFYIKNRPTYIDNADALLNGAPIDSIYKTASGELRIVV